MKNKKIVCILQARISSSRLPAKVLLPGYNKPLLLHTVERLKKSKLISNTIVATTKLKIDDVIYELCKINNVDVFRGHPTNLLDRYFKCAKKFNTKIIVRITSDCPLMDYKIVDKMIKKFCSSEIDYLSNIHPPSLPDGFDIEVFSFDALKKTYHNAKKEFQKEHVTPYIWDNHNKFKVKNYSFSKKENYYEKYRLTLDYKEDFYVIWKIYNELFPKKKYFEFKDIMEYLKKNPKVLINKKFIKVNWYKDHYKKLKTINQSDTKFLK